MKKARFWFEALARSAVVVMLAAAVAGCMGEEHEPATQAQLAALPFTLDIRQPFAPYDAGRWQVLLLADKGFGRVTPTIEIEVRTELSSGEFPAEKVLIDDWPDLKPYHNMVMEAPQWSQLARQPAVHIRGIATDDNGRGVRIEQKVAKLPQGYARILSFADENKYDDLRPVIEAIAASIWVN